jgi:hypothetical protein
MGGRNVAIFMTAIENRSAYLSPSLHTNTCEGSETKGPRRLNACIYIYIYPLHSQKIDFV